MDEDNNHNDDNPFTEAPELDPELLALEESLTRNKGGSGGRKKRDHSGVLRKAPTAPKRFKSSYICFFMAKQSEIKKELGNEATVASISKRSAEMWKNLSTEERTHWDNVAAQDKQRYNIEKAQYTGPWTVPWKRQRKDPAAPKRPMSAFLFFSQGRRTQIKNANPDMKNTEVSRILGETWRNLTDDERAPYVERERTEREKYKIEMNEWKKKQEEEQKIMQQQQYNNNNNPNNNIYHHELDQDGMQAALNDALPPDHPMMMAISVPPFQQQQQQQAVQQTPHPLPPYAYMPYPPPYAAGYYLPTNGKPVILNANGTPHVPIVDTTTMMKPAPPPPQQQHIMQQQVQYNDGHDGFDFAAAAADLFDT